MISSRYLSLTSALLTLNVNGCLSHAGYDFLFGKYPSIDFVSSSKCKEIACFSSVGTEMFPFSDISSISLIQSSNREKLSKLSFSVRRFHSLIFFKSLQMFLRFDNVDSTTLHLLVELVESSEDIGHVCQNENELRIFKTICMTVLVLSQKHG